MVQMVKLAEKETESLEVRFYNIIYALLLLLFFLDVVENFSNYFSGFTRVSRMKQKNTCLKNCRC